eukprot:scaffold17681_cov50-Phaeocystis_antarctica.AAC.1
MKKESVAPPAMLLERHAEPSVLENTSLPRRSADAPNPSHGASEPSLGTGLKNTSRAPSSLSSTPTVASFAGADSARESTSHGGICGDGGGGNGDGGGGLGLGDGGEGDGCDGDGGGGLGHGVGLVGGADGGGADGGRASHTSQHTGWSAATAAAAPRTRRRSSCIYSFSFSSSPCTSSSCMSSPCQCTVAG